MADLIGEHSLRYLEGIDFVGKTIEQTARTSAREKCLDFGAGEGYSLRRIEPFIQNFKEIWAYDIVDTGLPRLNLELRNRVKFTHFLPCEKFDLITMFFVAHHAVYAIDQAVDLLTDNGIIVIFDYHLKGKSREEVKRLCSSDLEREIIARQGAEDFYQRVTAMSADDYASRLSFLTDHSPKSRIVADKFCVVAGRK